MTEELRKMWSLAGQLSTQTSRVQRQLDDVRKSMDQLDEEEFVKMMAQMHSTTPPHLLLQENARLRDRNRLLDDEARELAMLLRDHERALETVLGKFRHQTLSMQTAIKQLKLQHMQELAKRNAQLLMYERHTAKLQEALQKLAVHVRQVVQDDSVPRITVEGDASELAQLHQENATLREMLFAMQNINQLADQATRDAWRDDSAEASKIRREHSIESLKSVASEAKKHNEPIAEQDEDEEDDDDEIEWKTPEQSLLEETAIEVFPQRLNPDTVRVLNTHVPWPEDSVTPKVEEVEDAYDDFMTLD
jgi:hypothetical protein